MKGWAFLGLGSLVNCWVIYWCCLDMYVVVGSSKTPTDLFLDALALLFLYNLDDIGADIAFIEQDDWPALRISWMYNEIVHPCPDDIFDEDKQDWTGWFFISIYKVTKHLLVPLVWIVPLLICMTPFTAIVPRDD